MGWVLLAILAIIFGIINRKEHKLIGIVLGFISIILVTIEIIVSRRAAADNSLRTLVVDDGPLGTARPVLRR